MLVSAMLCSSISCGRDSDLNEEIVQEVVGEEPNGEGNGEGGENTDTEAPTIPLNFTATNITPSTVDLSWDNATDNVAVTSYKVYQDEEEIDRISETSYQVRDLTPDTSYIFTVTALDAATNESEFSIPLEITTETTSDTEAPTTPLNLSVSNISETTLDLSWDAATDNVEVTSYKVYQDGEEIAMITEINHQVVDLVPNTSYDFSVTALDIAGNESEPSEILTATTLEATDTEAPTAPTNLSSSNITDSTLDLSWDAATDNVGVVSYRVFQDDVEVAVVTVTNYQIIDLAPNTSYDFRVTARDAAGNESESSETLTETTLEAPDTEAPTRPSNLSASNITATGLDLSWEASTDNIGVVSYRVFQDNVEVAMVATVNYQVEGLVPLTSYGFSIVAEDAAGNQSESSVVLNVSTLAAPDTEAPTAPANLMAGSITQTTIDLSWTMASDNVGVTSYRIYQNDTQIAMVTATNYQVTDLLANTSYDFTVTALDEAGNESESSNLLTVMTLEEPSGPTDQVLVFTKTEGFRHSSIAIGVSTLEALGVSNDFGITQTEDAANFTLNNLQQYQLVIFLNTTGDVLNLAQQNAFEQYIQNGGNYMGVHAATDTEFDWPWYGQLVGAYFDNHPNIQEASMDIVDQDHPSTMPLPLRWTRTDEWYNFRDMNPAINSLINLDESTYNGGEEGAIHPIAWFHEFDGGRSFYTAMGHTEASYNEPDFQAHLLGGVLYCLGR